MLGLHFLGTHHLPLPLQKLVSKPDSPILSLSMALKKTVLEKRKMAGSSSLVPPLSPENPDKFITLEAKKLYHESLYNRTFIARRGFSNSNVYFNFMIQENGWTKFCEHPPLVIASVVKEFHSNLRYRMDSTIYVRGKWLNFSAATINKVFNHVDDHSEAPTGPFSNTQTTTR